MEGPHAREDAGEVGAELGVGEEEEADAAVAVAEAVGGGEVRVEGLYPVRDYGR